VVVCGDTDNGGRLINKDKRFKVSKRTMRKSLLFSLLIYLLFFSCSNIYYVGLNTESLPIFSNTNTNSQVYYNIPVASKVLTKKKSKNYYHVIYQSYNGTLYKGYVFKPSYIDYHKFDSSIDGELYGYSSSKTKYSDPSLRNSSGTVNVKGYYRKNGTYVKPHTRSAPSKKH
jgi:hypothetical protein